MRIAWTHLAAADLEDIDAYIARDNPVAAAFVIDQIRESVEKLSEFPALGRDGMVSGTRELVIPTLPYVISYRVRTTIEVLAILHTARDRERAFAGRASPASETAPAKPRKGPRPLRKRRAT